MMIERLLKTAALVLLFSTSTLAQDSVYCHRLLAEGNLLFEKEQYHLAIRYYRQAQNLNLTNPSIDYKLAQCLRSTFQYTEALVCYRKVYENAQEQFPLSLYYYALMLKFSGNIPKAMEYFDQFISLHKGNAALQAFAEQAIIEKAGCEIAQQDQGFLTDAAALAKGEINTPYNDFAPAFRNAETLVVTSSRIASNRSMIDERFGEAFTDNYYFERRDSSWRERTRDQFSTANSRYNDGSGSFTADGNQYYFTVCGDRCSIYEIHLENGRWTRPKQLSETINDLHSENKQPAVSPGADTLYFASDRVGGYGMFDIWMSVRDATGQWSPAQNAGPVINTKANEVAPGITQLSNALFFSSNGHPGYGGYDMYVAKPKTTGEVLVYNLGYPFNSAMDDCYVTFNGDHMFWSSNRPGGAGGFDVYENEKLSALTLVSRLSVHNRNDSRVVTLTSRTARSESLQLLASRNEETIDYNHLTYEQKVVVNRMVENRMNNRENNPQEFPELTDVEFQTLDELSRMRLQSVMMTEKYSGRLLAEVPAADDPGRVNITGQLADERTDTALSGLRVLLTDEAGEILKMTTANKSGQFRFTDVPGDQHLFLRLEKSLAVESAAVRDILVTSARSEQGMYVENVYFDFDHFEVRPEAARVLTELAAYLRSNPATQVEIRAFADDRGSSAYNFELTQKRGEAVVSFLAEQGVDQTNLAIIPFGKQVIKHSVSEAQRQYNRRAEFFINGVHEQFTPSVRTYILKRTADWATLSKITGISESELKMLNDSAGDVLVPSQPVRLPASAKEISEDLFFTGI